MTLSRVIECHIVTSYLLAVVAFSHDLVWGWVVTLEVVSEVFWILMLLLVYEKLLQSSLFGRAVVGAAGLSLNTSSIMSWPVDVVTRLHERLLRQRFFRSSGVSGAAGLSFNTSSLGRWILLLVYMRGFSRRSLLCLCFLYHTMMEEYTVEQSDRMETLHGGEVSSTVGNAASAARASLVLPIL